MSGKWAIAGFGLAAMAACAPQEREVSAHEGRALFVENCALCHGYDAKGSGEVADLLTRKPADLTRIAARNGGQVPRAKVLSKIDGYQRVQVEGIDMPEFGELFAGDTVLLDTGDGILTPTPADLVELLAYLESIQETD